MELKENLLSKHLLLKEELDLNSWLSEIRSQAIERFENLGFPKRRNEDWKYLNLNPLLNVDYKINLSSDYHIEHGDIRQYLVNDIESYKIVFINGKYSSWLSQTTHDNYDVCILSSALSKDKYNKVVHKYFNSSPIKDESFVSLNTSFAQEGAYINIPDNIEVEKPIQLLFLTTDVNASVMHHPRNLIVIGKNSKVKIIERHQNLSGDNVFTNSVSEVFVNTLSQLDWYKIQNDTEKSSLIDYTAIVQESNSIASVNTFTFGGNLTRNNLNFYQEGQFIESNLSGITLVSDSQVVDHHTLVNHKTPNCVSNEYYKGIYGGRSKGVFNGKVIVHSKAQKTDAFQQNNNILLSDTATINTKPQLEIFADDVKCSHGCTIGRLDNEALFYLQSRGIPKKEAKALLLFAFANDIIDKISIPKLKSRINHFIASKLGMEIDFDL